MFRSLFYYSIPLLAIFGWCYNIYKIFHLDGMSGELAVRAIGIIVAPLGAIMGYI